MKIKKELITPAIARQMLDKNIEHNRKINPVRVIAYADDMSNGDWETETGETIKFNTDGFLIDGQHRLSAVMVSKTSVEMYVAYDVPPEALYLLDTGKSRTFGDTLKIKEIPNGNRAGAVAKWVAMYRLGFPTNKGHRNITPAQLLKTFEKDPEGFAEAARRADDLRRMKLSTSIVGGVAFYLFNEISPSLASNFFDQLVSGANLPTKSPILVLRNRLMRASESRIKPYEFLVLYIRAWNNFLTDTPSSNLLITGVDKKPINNQNFPSIKQPSKRWSS